MQDEVSQEAREAAENFMNAHGWLCEEDWSLVLEADREVIAKFFAKFEQSIRQQAERGEVVEVGIAGPFAGSDGGFTTVVFHASKVPVGTVIYTLPTPPEAA